MTKAEFTSRLHKGMTAVEMSPQLRHRVLAAAQGKEEIIMKKKACAVLVLVLLIVAVCAAAIAAAQRAGILDFAGRYVGSYVPEDAQQYVQTDVLHAENEIVSVRISELYYDGRISRMTVDVTPKDPKTLLLGMDMSPDDLWQNMLRLNEWDESDTRTAIDVYREGGYENVYCVQSALFPESADIIGGSADYHLNEDGTLTLYDQVEYETAQSACEAVFKLYLTPLQTPLASDSLRLPEEQLVIEKPISLQEVPSEGAWLSTEPADFPSIGVRVDSLRIEVKPQDIHAIIEYTVTDREAYSRTDDGLWFEFIDPESTADQPYAQRLPSGLTGTGSVIPLDGDHETATRFRQIESLGRNELHESYTIRAYECWEKQRFETRTVEVCKAE